MFSGREWVILYDTQSGKYYMARKTAHLRLFKYTQFRINVLETFDSKLFSEPKGEKKPTLSNVFGSKGKTNEASKW